MTPRRAAIRWQCSGRVVVVPVPFSVAVAVVVVVVVVSTQNMDEHIKNTILKVQIKFDNSIWFRFKIYLMFACSYQSSVHFSDVEDESFGLQQNVIESR